MPYCVAKVIAEPKSQTQKSWLLSLFTDKPLKKRLPPAHWESI